MNSPTEMKYAFTVQYNNIMNNAAPGINDYEASRILTKAGEELVKNYFMPGGNKYVVGFDGSARRQEQFESFIYTKALAATQELGGEGIQSELPPDLNANAQSYVLDFDYLALINVVLVSQDKTKIRQVVMLDYKEYQRRMSRVYKYPYKNQAWGLLAKNTLVVFLNGEDKDIEWTCAARYVKIPDPIILVDLSTLEQGLTINGKHEPSLGDYPASMHEEIVQRAVEIAKATYSTDQSGQAQMQNQIVIGQRSE